MKYLLMVVAVLTLASCSHMETSGASGGPETNARSSGPFSRFGDVSDIYIGG
jgi:hypothetical protein